MANIKKFEEFESNKFNNIQTTNEFFGGIIKKLFQNAKDNLSLKVSKQIGGAGEIDKAIEQYKSKMEPLIDKELEAQKKLIEYEIGLEEAGGDEKGLEKIRAEVDKEKDVVSKMKEAAKKTFNTQVSNIMRKEDDKNIKGYINLKRAELAEELLAKELGQIKEMGGEKLENDDKFKQWVEGLEQKAVKTGELAKKMYSKLTDKLKGGDEEVEYQEGDKIKYTKKDESENEAEVMNQDDVEEGWIRLKTDKNQTGFTIQKDKIVGKVEDIEADKKSDETEEADSENDMADLNEE